MKEHAKTSFMLSREMMELKKDGLRFEIEMNKSKESLVAFEKEIELWMYFWVVGLILKTLGISKKREMSWVKVHLIEVRFDTWKTDWSLIASLFFEEISKVRLFKADFTEKSNTSDEKLVICTSWVGGKIMFFEESMNLLLDIFMKENLQGFRHTSQWEQLDPEEQISHVEQFKHFFESESESESL